VVTPVAVTLSGPTATNQTFKFTYSANPGLRYVVQTSSNLVNWVPLVTNVAASDPVVFSAGAVTNTSRFYRVGRLPNP
jgi:hypothetical protein